MWWKEKYWISCPDCDATCDQQPQHKPGCSHLPKNTTSMLCVLPETLLSNWSELWGMLEDQPWLCHHLLLMEGVPWLQRHLWLTTCRNNGFIWSRLLVLHQQYHLSCPYGRGIQNGFATHFQVTLLFSMRTESQVSLQHCCSVDADAWCKRALTRIMNEDKAQIRLPTLALKFRSDVTRSPKQGYQWPHKNYLCSPNLKEKNCCLSPWWYRSKRQCLAWYQSGISIWKFLFALNSPPYCWQLFEFSQNIFTQSSAKPVYENV